MTVEQCFICQKSVEFTDPAQCHTTWDVVNEMWQIICDDCADAAGADDLDRCDQCGGREPHDPSRCA